MSEKKLQSVSPVNPENQQEPLYLVAQAPDPATQIWIYDGRLRLQAEGVGRLKIEAVPGMYKVRFQTGTAAREFYKAVRPGTKVTQVEAELRDLKFAAAAPLAETAASHEYHGMHARRISGETPLQKGRGSCLMIFARDYKPKELATEAAPPWWDYPAAGLSLHDAQGKLLADLETESEHSSNDNDEPDRWSAYHVELTPGSYRLRVRGGKHGVAEQCVSLCQGWQTQVFLLRQDEPSGNEPAGNELLGDGPAPKEIPRRVNLATASVFMAREIDTFDQHSPVVRLTELARQALAAQHPLISDGIVRAAVQDYSLKTEDYKRDSASYSVIKEMLDSKFANPMLGIYGAYLLLMQPKPDFALLRIVARNLKKLAGDHPDVQILHNRIFGGNLPPQSAPPMLRASWQRLIQISAEQPETIPANSLAARIAPLVLSSGAWLNWRPDEALLSETEMTKSVMSHPTPLRDAVATLMPSATMPSATSKNFTGTDAFLSDSDGRSFDVEILESLGSQEKSFTSVKGSNDFPTIPGLPDGSDFTAGFSTSNLGEQFANGDTDWIEPMSKEVHQTQSIETAVESFATRKGLTPLEAGIFAYITEACLCPSLDAKAFSYWRQQTVTELATALRRGLETLEDKDSPLSNAAMVRAFALPPAVLSESVMSLASKINQSGVVR